MFPSELSSRSKIDLVGLLRAVVDRQSGRSIRSDDEETGPVFGVGKALNVI